MNTLSSYISESLLDIDNVDNSNVLIEEFLKDNYDINGSYTIKDGVVDINGDIKVINKKITHFTNGLFQFGEVKNNFYCINCRLLKILKGAPERVGGDFNCNSCTSLKSLEGAPKEVGGGFICSFCKSLESLKDAPERVGGDFNCNYCKSLTSLKGAPKEVGGSFYCEYCNKKFTEEEVTTICKVKRSIYL